MKTLSLLFILLPTICFSQIGYYHKNKQLEKKELIPRQELQVGVNEMGFSVIGSKSPEMAVGYGLNLNHIFLADRAFNPVFGFEFNKSGVYQETHTNTDVLMNDYRVSGFSIPLKLRYTTPTYNRLRFYGQLGVSPELLLINEYQSSKFGQQLGAQTRSSDTRA